MPRILMTLLLSSSVQVNELSTAFYLNVFEIFLASHGCVKVILFQETLKPMNSTRIL